MKYVPPYGSSDPNAPYLNGNPQTGQLGSIPPAAAFEHVQREILAVITSAGLAPDPNNLTQLWQAIQRAKRATYAVDTGAANAVVITPEPAPQGYVEGDGYLVKIAAGNTGAAAINIASLGAKQIVRLNGQPLAKGDLVAGGIAFIVYDGVNFQLESASAAISALTQVAFWHSGHDTGVANALIVDDAKPTVFAYDFGVTIAVLAAAANTGNATINIASLGVKNIRRAGGAALQANDIVAGGVAMLIYDGTQFELLNPRGAWGGGGGGGGTLPDHWADITGTLAAYWLTVKSATTTAPPGSPTAGDLYLIPTGATGGWSGLSHRIAQYTGATLGWVYRDYPVASLISVTDTKKFKTRSASGWDDAFMPSHPVRQKINGPTTAVVGKAYLGDTSAGSFNLTLPAAPEDGATIFIADGWNFATNSMGLVPGAGDQIAGQGAGVTVSVNIKLISFALEYRSADLDWRIT